MVHLNMNKISEVLFTIFIQIPLFLTLCLWTNLELILYIILRYTVWLLEHFRFARSHHKLRYKVRTGENISSYEEWKQLAKKLDRIDNREKWKTSLTDSSFNYRTVHGLILQLHTTCEALRQYCDNIEQQLSSDVLINNIASSPNNGNDILPYQQQQQQQRNDSVIGDLPGQSPYHRVHSVSTPHQSTSTSPLLDQQEFHHYNTISSGSGTAGRYEQNPTVNTIHTPATLGAKIYNKTSRPGTAAVAATHSQKKSSNNNQRQNSTKSQQQEQQQPQQTPSQHQSPSPPSTASPQLLSQSKSSSQSPLSLDISRSSHTPASGGIASSPSPTSLLQHRKLSTPSFTTAYPNDAAAAAAPANTGSSPSSYESLEQQLSNDQNSQTPHPPRRLSQLFNNTAAAHASDDEALHTSNNPHQTYNNSTDSYDSSIDTDEDDDYDDDDDDEDSDIDGELSSKKKHKRSNKLQNTSSLQQTSSQHTTLPKHIDYDELLSIDHIKSFVNRDYTPGIGDYDIDLTAVADPLQLAVAPGVGISDQPASKMPPSTTNASALPLPPIASLSASQPNDMFLYSNNASGYTNAGVVPVSPVPYDISTTSEIYPTAAQDRLPTAPQLPQATTTTTTTTNDNEQKHIAYHKNNISQPPSSRKHHARRRSSGVTPSVAPSGVSLSAVSTSTKLAAAAAVKQLLLKPVPSDIPRDVITSRPHVAPSHITAMMEQRAQDTTLIGLVHNLTHAIQLALRQNIGLINEELYSHTNVGTKSLINTFLHVLTMAIDTLAILPSNIVPPETRLEILLGLQQLYGQNALLLSGGARFGCYHWGLAKVLHESGLLRQLKVISGTSAGTCIAAYLCTRTDKELTEEGFDPAVLTRYMAFDTGMTVWTKVYNLIKNGYMFDPSQWLTRLHYFSCGDMTFLEAYKKTGRVLVITATPSQRNEPPIFLSYLTSPHCVISSAMVASAAIPYVLPAVNLLFKDPMTGVITENRTVYSQLKDGSFSSDIPSHDLSHYFNCHFQLVSQCNPHISFFYFNRRGDSGRTTASWAGHRGTFFISLLESWLKFDMAKNLLVMKEMELWPKLFHFNDMANLFLQNFSGPEHSVCLVPQTRLIDYFYLLSSPTYNDMLYMIKRGEFMVWTKLSLINARLCVSKSISEGLTSIEHEIVKLRLEQEQFNTQQLQSQYVPSDSSHCSHALLEYDLGGDDSTDDE